MTKSNIKLSVVVITYNQKDTISVTLDSILSQEHDYVYEIVVGDDCSSDGTRDILLYYQSRYPNIIRLLLNEKNLGIVGNYFNVIRQCRGEYIMECAGDDWWLSGKIALQVPYMDAHLECGLCYTKASYYNQLEKQQCGVWGGNYTQFDELIEVNTIPALTIITRTDLVLKYIEEIVPESHNWKMEDYPMWLWFAHESNIDFIDEITAVYRVLLSSASHSQDVSLKSAFAQSCIDIQTYFIERYDAKGVDIEYIRLKSMLHIQALYGSISSYVDIWRKSIMKHPKYLLKCKPYAYLLFFIVPCLRERYIH